MDKPMADLLADKSAKLKGLLPALLRLPPRRLGYIIYDT